jgi:hypothetical protein
MTKRRPKHANKRKSVVKEKMHGSQKKQTAERKDKMK